MAYPFGEIGQEEGSNVARLVDPVRTLLGEADREYQLGFVVDAFGYTCPGDDLLTVRRFEPDWNADAADVVAEVLENHPVFQARRMRAEIATLMNKPYLAERQIELLRRDGYPERRLRELVAFAQNRIPAERAVAVDEAGRTGTSRNRLRPSNLYVAGLYRENQSNDDIVQRYGEGRAGLNLSARLGLGACQPDSSSVVVVAHINDVPVGLLVDAVCDIIAVTEDMVQPPPGVGTDEVREFVQGIISTDEGIVTLLSLDQVLPTERAAA